LEGVLDVSEERVSDLTEQIIEVILSPHVLM